MKKLIILLSIVLLFQVSIIAQSIYVSKDSLSIFPTESNYELADTFYIANVGDSNLIIDSLKTVHDYGYQIILNSSDTTIYINFINYVPIDVITLEPHDTLQVIFANPDLCPFCDRPVYYEPFTDTVTIFSNSDITPEYSISINGLGTTDIENDNLIDAQFKLYQNYPNPFNPTTTIAYSISEATNVELEIFDLLGQKISVLVNEFKNIGTYKAIFNGQSLPSGFYICRLKTNKYTQLRKLLLLK